MDRKIKFRVWYPNYKKMETGTEINLENTCMDIRNGKIIFDIDEFEYDEEPEYFSESGYILMQFTGLCDKNGKEIYEGDIVVQDDYIWFDEGKPNYVGTVEWVYSEWQVIAHCINPDKSGISDGMNYSLNDSGIDENTNSYWLIIGNIYENPELLENK